MKADSGGVGADTGTNKAAARLLAEIADLLELKQENPFKVRAYRKAARVIEGLDRSLDELWKNGELTSLPGVGKAICEKLAQFLQQGRIDYHIALKAEFPPQLLELMEVPGIGPRKAAALYKELRISSLSQLRQALSQGRVRGVKGFGPRSEARLLQALDKVESMRRRFTLGEAYGAAELLKKMLLERTELEEVLISGALRRGEELVDTIELVCVCCRTGVSLWEILSCLHAGIDSVIERSSDRLVIRFAEEMAVRTMVAFTLVEPVYLGAVLLYCTGPQAHIRWLEQLAEDRGMRLTSKGLYTQGGKLLSRTENEIYAALGLPFVPPELRGEQCSFEMAEYSVIPDLVAENTIVGNLHTHSDWSDGSDSLENLLLESLKRGYKYLAITDHSQSLQIARGLTITRLYEQLDVLNVLSSKYSQLTVLKGTECDILPDGTLDYPNDVLDELDIVVASVHSKFRMSCEEMTRRILRALEHPSVKILGHPTGRILGKRDEIEADWEEIFRCAARNGKALEINGYTARLDLPARLVRRAASYGVKFSVATDAHGCSGFYNMKFGVSVARSGGLTSKQVVNCWDEEKLLHWLGIVK